MTTTIDYQHGERALADADKVAEILDELDRALVEHADVIGERPEKLTELVDGYISADWRVDHARRPQLVHDLLAKERLELRGLGVEERLGRFEHYAQRRWFRHYQDEVVRLLLADRFVIDSVVGFGGFGRVYRARMADPRRRVVALKVLIPADDTGALLDDGQRGTLEARFAREADALRKTNHPSLPKIYDQSHIDGLSYIVMEFIDGGPLSKSWEGKPTAGRVNHVLRWMLQIGDAVAHCHRLGIIHRDIKPANILKARHSIWDCARGREPRLCLVDFGLARPLDDDELTRTGCSIGSFGYASPEQLAGSRDLDGRSDIFAFGATVYALISGRTAYSGKHIPGHGVQPLADVVEGVDHKLSDIVGRCLELDPENRYQRIDDACEALKGCLRPPRMTRRRALLAMGGTLALGTAGYHFHCPDRRTRLAQVASRHLREYTTKILGSRREDGWLPPSLATEGWPPPEVYAHVQALYACLRAGAVPQDDVRRLTESLVLPFRVGDVTKPWGRYQYASAENPPRNLGWLSRSTQTYTLGEPVAWALAALGVALGRPGCASFHAELRDHYKTAAGILENYHPTSGPPGAWNMYARQSDPSQHSVYMGALVLQAATEAETTNRIGPTSGVAALGRPTAVRLSARFNHPRPEGRDGWVGQLDARPSAGDDGLSLNVYHLLLRAARVGLSAPVDSAIVLAAVARMRECCARAASHPDEYCGLSSDIVNLFGKPEMARERTRFLWYPHAVMTAVELIHLAEGAGIPSVSPASLWDMLYRLVYAIGDAVFHKVTQQNFLFVYSEHLLALTAVERLTDRDVGPR